MKKPIAGLLLSLVFTACLALAQSNEYENGEVRQNSNSKSEAWDAAGAEWVSLDAFWENYAARRGGLTWGKRTDYPPYKEVREFDTMIIQLDSGSCMLMFFHTRWRRANDVRRWDHAFNEYSGCPRVFD